MSKCSVSETRAGPPASETSSRQVQPSSTAYSQRLPSPSRASSPPPSPGQHLFPDDHHLKIGFGSTDVYLLDQASPGLNALYNDDNQDRVNLKHALEDLSQEARRSANGDSHGNTNGNHSNKRAKMEAPQKVSPSKNNSPASPRRNGVKAASGSPAAKVRKTS